MAHNATYRSHFPPQLRPPLMPHWIILLPILGTIALDYEVLSSRPKTNRYVDRLVFTVGGLVLVGNLQYGVQSPRPLPPSGKC